MNDIENLTIDWGALSEVIKGIQLDTPVLEMRKPSQPEQGTNESFLVLEQRGLVRLSDETRRMEEERLARLNRKRKPYTRKKGTVHPKKKLKTKRLRAERRWSRDPVGCLQNSYGYWTLDRELWNQLIAPLWKSHPPAQLEVVRTGKGTEADPHCLWNIQVVHKKTKAVLYDGNAALLYRLSCSDAAVPASLQE